MDQEHQGGALGRCSGQHLDPEGFQLGLRPTQTWEEFLAKGAANYKKLPAGWKLRVMTLDQDVIEIPDNNLATIMTDELFTCGTRLGRA